MSRWLAAPAGDQQSTDGGWDEGPACTIAIPFPPTTGMKYDVIDGLRAQIQHRLDQIVSEADRLRRALAALDPRSSSPPARKDRRQTGRARAQPRPGGRKATPKRAETARRARAVKPGAGKSATRGRPARRSAGSPVASSVRTAPGATRAAVLAALAGGEPLTAGELAEKSGLARSAVSSTLSRLARSGEVQKAERGYRLAPTELATRAVTAAPTEPTTNTGPGESGDTAAGETAETADPEAAETPARGTAHAEAGAPNQATSTGPDQIDVARATGSQDNEPA